MTEMLDMSRFTEAKSDQLNADDLIGISKTITITRVVGADGDQPVAIYYQGDNGKPFKPCKTIRRVLMAVWGRYANEYVGRSMTVYRDDKVTFGGLETGGIRISHMSNIDKETVVVVMKSKGKKAGLKILPLRMDEQAAQKADKAADGVRTLVARIVSVDEKNLDGLLEDPVVVKQRAWLAGNRPELAAQVDAAVTLKRSAAIVDDDPFGAGKPDEDTGEAFTAEDLIDHINRKGRVEDVNSLVASRADEIASYNEEERALVAEAQANRIAAIREAANG